jgi:hypothetical protein
VTSCSPVVKYTWAKFLPRSWLSFVDLSLVQMSTVLMFGCSWFIIFLVVCCNFGLQIAIWFLFMLTLCSSNYTRKGSKQEVRW